MGNFHTLIVYDFDDTLFPTAFFTRNRLHQFSRFQLPRNVLLAFASLESSVIELLRESKRHGTVKIVSNGNMRWLLFAIRGYMPRLLRFLRRNNIEVISAVDRRRANVNDPMIWKHDVFRHLLADIYDRTICPCLVKLISVGDGEAERQAALSLSSFLPLNRIRIVKFPPNPSLPDLDMRLQNMREQIASVVRRRSHVDTLLL